MPKLPEHPIFSKPGEPFVVVSLMAGNGPERKLLREHFNTSERPLHYIGVDANGQKPAEPGLHYSEELHNVKLFVDDPELFSEQLADVMKGRLADQIHVHLTPPEFPFHRRDELLQRIGKHLKPGGRIFHAITRNSFLVPGEEQGLYRFVYPWRLARFARQSGLVLETFAQKRDKNGNEQIKVKREKREGSNTRQAAQTRTARFNQAAQRRSDWWNYMGTHFLVFRKPAKPPAPRKA